MCCGVAYIKHKEDPSIPPLQTNGSFLWAEPNSLVGKVCRLENSRSLVRTPARPTFFPRVDDSKATGFIPLSPLSVVLTMVSWKAASGFERILCRVLV